ncbi:addiction module antitoxin (plasmid) [Candidatus Williamhamiltonella defendens]|uniref:Addiction module, antitoxin ChpS n=2 Tax=Candidatus Williamhamiltonella defendens TaxID=138072 RepID=C4K633_HAMD5|nr:AbrB/MazE/SpoVT family DNA-binding domain-containing protein [Candidatus Hamiltonella defensa]ACQ68026.1 addiction module, antitoxin ChpS [Candidatus Hamiltonella defensa 5AT (Acyrthosiphon pisum)]ATW22648.1 addiction module antitoxin [Candidatus Hamiltonella defensa]ATW30798.1 addiction module antitoxin [Candidatus Hamiltonella defensa]ATW32831.1 addiction module antitoxin [Candidatus Hamiltonella defensa]
MEIVIRKIGNSKGAVIPAALLGELNLAVGDKAEARNENGTLIIVPKKRKKYCLEMLIAKCDSNTSIPKELKDWDQVQPEGNEI